MKEIIKKIIVENQEFNISTKKRSFSFPNTQKIITLIGPRRVGKSYLFFDYINDLKKKVSIDKILFINFDDERLLPIESSNLDLIIESYFELYPENLNENIYLFFDEIQNIENWELFVRRLYDNKNYSIFLTGSSSKLLSKEIATSLRGRTLSFDIYPLSFKEFLYFKDYPLEKNFEFSQKRFKIKNFFEEYLEFGGFPEIVVEELKFKVLQSYLDLTIYKDLIDRYNLRNISLLKNLLKFLLSNISKEFSINSYYNSIKKEMRVSRETIIEYNSYLEDINLIHFLYKYDFSLKSQHSSKRKVYSIDLGFSNANGFKFSEEKGRLLENLVFIELKRRENEIYYFREKFECDFIIKNGLDITQVIQVTKSLENEKTKEREFRGLIEAMNFFNLNEGLILTQDEEGEEIIGNKKIKILPIWKWLLK